MPLLTRAAVAFFTLAFYQGCIIFRIPPPSWGGNFIKLGKFIKREGREERKKGKKRGKGKEKRGWKREKRGKKREKKREKEEKREIFTLGT